MPQGELLRSTLVIIRTLGGGGLLGLTLLTHGHATNGADQTDERAAAATGISLGSPFLIAACAADHSIMLFTHLRLPRPAALDHPDRSET